MNVILEDTDKVKRDIGDIVEVSDSILKTSVLAVVSMQNYKIQLVLLNGKGTVQVKHLETDEYEDLTATTLEQLEYILKNAESILSYKWFGASDYQMVIRRIE